MADSRFSNRRAGTVSVAVGVVALVAYAVLGASPESPDLPTTRLLLAALLVVLGGALRQSAVTVPRWGQVVVGLLAGFVAYDVLRALLG